MKKLEKIVTILGIVAVGLTTIFGAIRIGSHYFQKAVPAAEIQLYIEKISPMGQKISEVMESVTPLFNNFANANKQDALHQVVDAKDKLITIQEEAKSFTPPATLTSTHDRFKEAVGNYVDSFKMIEFSIQQNDSDKSKMAADLLIKGSNGLKEVAEEITAMKDKK